MRDNDNGALMVRVEAGRLSASDLEHPDLQPLLLPLDKFDGKRSSRLPGAVIKNAGGGKQKHWATCWVVDRKPKHTNARNEVRRCRRLPSPKTNGSKPTAPRSPPHCSPLTTHHCSPPPFTTSTVPTANLLTALPSAVAAGGSRRGVPSRPRRLLGLEGGRLSAHPLRWHGGHGNH